MVTSAPAGLAPAGDRPPVLRLAGVSRRFGGMVAVGGVDLELAPGERLGVIGPNGAGKTTLFRLIAGELRPNDGRIELLGQDVTRTPAWRRARMGLSRTFQVANLFGRLSVGDNMRLAIAGRGPAARRPLRRSQPDTAMDETVADTLARVGLHGRTTDLVASLSHGEQRQLEIAMALATGPRMLLLDEPMAGMGKEESERMTALLRGLKGEETILLVEHDMDVVFALADRITVLVYGRAIATGTPTQIRADDAVRAAFLGAAVEP
jgi:branched-chain amino acid transport system ATP-binding protein